MSGAFSGLGLQGAFTIADSKVGGGDPLAGYPLQGVSKYNYTVGLLYEKYGISGRIVYTYRPKYFDADASGQPPLRPVPPEDTMNKDIQIGSAECMEIVVQDVCIYECEWSYKQQQNNK